MPPVKPLFGTPLNRAHPLAQGLVGCWLLNEGSGNKAYDSSGNGNHTTFVDFANPPTPASGWCAGPHGGALAFDGNADSFYVNKVILPQYEFSIATSFIIRSNNAFDIYGSKIVAQEYISIAISNANILGYSIRGTGSVGLSSPELNKNYDIVLTYNYYANPSVIFYINGVNILTSNDIVLVSNPSQFRAGNASANRCPDGVMSYLHAYSRALSSSEVSILNADPYCMFEYEYPIEQHFYRNKKIHAELVAVSFLQAIPERQAEISAMLQSLASVSGQAEIIRELSANLTSVSLIQGAAIRLQELRAILESVSALTGQAQISRQVSADLRAIGFPEAVAECIRTFYELTAQLVAVSQGYANASQEQDISAQLVAIAALNGRAKTHYRTVLLQFETIMKKYHFDQATFHTTLHEETIL